jgi:hypothetical protein
MRAIQGSFFNALEGFRYRAELLAQAEEETLLTQVRKLPFREFEFHGYTGTMSNSQLLALMS